MFNTFLTMAPPAAEGGNALMQFLPFLLLVVVFYFFMIRPQMRRQKELGKYREALKKGDKVITTGGIYGRVAEIKDDHVMMEISDNVKIRIDKSAIIMDMTDALKK